MALSVFSRYRSLPVIDVDGRRTIAHRPPPDRQAVSSDGAAEHVVVGGETLDMLAARYYGREELWWRIADANPLALLFQLAPGNRLLIPALRVATSTTTRR